MPCDTHHKNAEISDFSPKKAANRQTFHARTFLVTKTHHHRDRLAAVMTLKNAGNLTLRSKRTYLVSASISA